MSYVERRNYVSIKLKELSYLPWYRGFSFFPLSFSLIFFSLTLPSDVMFEKKIKRAICLDPDKKKNHCTQKRVSLKYLDRSRSENNFVGLLK